MSLQQILLNKLKAQNPKAYETLLEIKRSGKDPNEVLREMRASGRITDAQLEAAKRQARLLGASLPEEGENPQPKAKSPFSGLF